MPSGGTEYWMGHVIVRKPRIGDKISEFQSDALEQARDRQILIENNLKVGLKVQQTM